VNIAHGAHVIVRDPADLPDQVGLPVLEQVPPCVVREQHAHHVEYTARFPLFPALDLQHLPLRRRALLARPNDGWVSVLPALQWDPAATFNAATNPLPPPAKHRRTPEVFATGTHEAVVLKDQNSDLPRKASPRWALVAAQGRSPGVAS